MRNIDFKRTERGFSRVDFDDLYGARCSLQKSSLATEDAIWLGQNEPTAHHVTGEIVGCRMHLTQEDVRWLLPILTHFAATGELPAAIDPGSAALPRKDVEGAASPSEELARLSALAMPYREGAWYFDNDEVRNRFIDLAVPFIEAAAIRDLGKQTGGADA